MIVGIGTDMIEIKRIEKAAEKESFLQKYFTEEERRFFQSKGGKSETIAGRFAAKEAAAKALGTGFRGFGPIDIEILCDGRGKPILHFYNGAAEIKRQKNISAVHISISHNRENAIAFVVLEGGVAQ